MQSCSSMGWWKKHNYTESLLFATFELIPVLLLLPAVPHKATEARF